MDGISVSVSRLGPEPAAHRAGRPGSRLAGRRLACRLALAAADLVTILLALGLAAFALGWPLTPQGPLSYLAAACALAAIVPAAISGMYDPVGFSPLERLRLRCYGAAMLTPFALLIAALGSPVGPADVALFALTALCFLPLGSVAEAFTSRILAARTGWGKDVVIIGSGVAAERLAAALLATPQAGMRPVGYCGDLATAGALAALPRLGSLEEIEHLDPAADIAVIALAPETRALELARLPFSRVAVVPDFPMVPANRVRSRALGGLVVLDVSNPARTQLWANRLLDCLIAVPALFLALPVIAGVALAIRLVNPGPALFVQRRVGWKGRPVAILKLRSMYVDADRRLAELFERDPEARREWDTFVKLSRDPRVLPGIGSFIRRTSIDELPQLWNVIRGDLSLVGPRPFPGYHVQKFPPAFQALRCSVRPGLTGLWQVTERSGADLQRQESIDTFYIRNRSIWLDLYVVFRTIPAILGARGAH